MQIYCQVSEAARLLFLNTNLILLGLYTLHVYPERSATSIGQISFPILPLNFDEANEEFERLVTPFYKVLATCARQSSDNDDEKKSTLTMTACEQSEWSRFYPDEKTQIAYGFNTSANSLH